MSHRPILFNSMGAKRQQGPCQSAANEAARHGSSCYDFSPTLLPLSFLPEPAELLYLDLPSLVVAAVFHTPKVCASLPEPVAPCPFAACACTDWWAATATSVTGPTPCTIFISASQAGLGNTLMACSRMLISPWLMRLKRGDSCCSWLMDTC